MKRFPGCPHRGHWTPWLVWRRPWWRSGTPGPGTPADKQSWEKTLSKSKYTIPLTITWINHDWNYLVCEESLVLPGPGLVADRPGQLVVRVNCEQHVLPLPVKSPDKRWHTATADGWYCEQHMLLQYRYTVFCASVRSVNNKFDT